MTRGTTRTGTGSEEVERLAERIDGMIREHCDMEDASEAEARAVAHGLIQGYIGPDHKVIAMRDFYSALVQALQEQRARVVTR
ncbi:hypothetical protein AUC68_11200 [Methyloceanibacter methanicus]|uniref:Uncharacterized protein n=1 Tax=Methyloceanibacter methanicus TaxID=1774968 RepID=A0A1E3VWZ0_9HYPH|nr:hypothetical protein [Methyloceanibacter methanicus]ODR98058.1 hypothetical protein AUC68_11200 [Methyloceanibacter methanicus]